MIFCFISLILIFASRIGTSQLTLIFMCFWANLESLGIIVVCDSLVPFVRVFDLCPPCSNHIMNAFTVRLEETDMNYAL
jgi:hypothetical protein